ncbi:MAG: hypothetical protein LC798_06615 [Chloroflexi bacterium]|nr:hypothetical protein [Chloroflexota bacterium]
MAAPTAPGTAIERLAHDLTDRDASDGLTRELVEWLAGSARFRAFAVTYRDKIRKKLRGATGDEARRDVRAELRVAQLLLADRRIELAFEPYGSGKAGPDFTVAFRGERPFNLEVTRLQRLPTSEHFTRALLAKLRQLPPSTSNAVLVAIEGDGAAALDVAAATRALRARADAKEEEGFALAGLKGTRGFYQRYLRLGAVLLWCEGGVGDAGAALWSNRSANIALSERAVRACVACLRASDDSVAMVRR